MNKMKEVAELLGVQLDEEFNVIDKDGNVRECKYRLSEEGILDCTGHDAPYTLYRLLTGEYKIKKPILDKVEKQYLENVLRPFRDRVEYIAKYRVIVNSKDSEYIVITVTNDSSISFPRFKSGSMYKNMELRKRYTLKELGLFENE